MLGDQPWVVPCAKIEKKRPRGIEKKQGTEGEGLGEGEKVTSERRAERRPPEGMVRALSWLGKG